MRRNRLSGGCAQSGLSDRWGRTQRACGNRRLCRHTGRRRGEGAGGGPAGQTTTVSYYIFQEGFETGKLAYSSAIAWFLFFLVFTVTVFNWRFGNRYVND
ncbi:MAG: hypothetical protein AAF656_00335 [Planctomycetota bacterium]